MTYAGSIGGNEGLAKLGSGTLTLSAANTYNGVTTVSAGTLDLSNQNALQNSTLATSGTGGVAFDSSVAGHAFTLGGLSGSGNMTLQDNAATPNAVALTVGGNNASTTYSGVLSGAGSLIKSGNGVMTVANSNTYSGATTILGGTLKLAYPTITLTLSPTAATAESWWSQGQSYGRSPTNAIDGAGMTPNNPVTPASTAGNNASNMWLSNGYVQTWIAFDLGANYTITGFTLWNYNEWYPGNDLTGRSVQTAGMYVGTTMPANNDSYTDQGPNWGTLAQSYTFSKATGAASLPGSNYSFSTPVSSRYIELYVGSNWENANDYTGISQILFDATAPVPVPVLPMATPVSIATGATLDLNGVNQTVAALNDYTTGSQGAVTNSGATPVTLTLAPSGGTATFSGSIGDGSGGVSLVLNGSATQILAGSNTYTGPTTVNAGTLQIGNGTSGEGLASPSITLSNNATLAFNHADPLSYGGAISGSGQLIKLGVGVLDLSGTSTYSGPTKISAGTVELDGNGENLPAATALTIASGGVLDLAGVPQTVGSLSGSAGAIVTNRYANYPSTLTVAPSAGSTTFAGNIIGNNALALSGSGELTLSGTNAYTGGTTVSGGTLDIAAPSALAGSGLVTIAAGGRLVLGSGAGIGALLAASSPVGSDAVALSAAAVPATLGGPQSGYENMATLGGAPPLSQGGGGSAVGGTAAAVPEPGTLALLAAGILMLAVARWRRRR